MQKVTMTERLRPSNDHLNGAEMVRHAQAVRAADLEQALLVLPFADALRLFEHVLAWLRDGPQVHRGFYEVMHRAHSRTEVLS